MKVFVKQSPIEISTDQKRVLAEVQDASGQTVTLELPIKIINYYEHSTVSE